MRNAFKVTLWLLIVAATGCGKSDPPPPATETTRSSAPVKNVESLPSGTIREGARTMNQGAEMGADLEQQKQERGREIESQSE